jgi:hypothetical protein
VLKAEEADEA